MDIIFQCVGCHHQYSGQEIRYRCDCGEILEVVNNLHKVPKTVNTSLFSKRLQSLTIPYRSGVWRYKELVLPIDEKYIVSKPEGNTNLYSSERITKYAGVKKLFLKHEGENPTGSFKDRGMTVGMSVAKMLKVKAVACASTGNTSASLASYAALAGIPCFVFIPQGKISSEKLFQTMAYGATIIQVLGDFDHAMKLVEQVCTSMNIYLLNSINPFRIEGQKTILFELLQQRDWCVPDWIVLPAGNLGNISAIGKGLGELQALGHINKLPRIAAIQASGANPLYRSFTMRYKKRFKVKAKTVATAIQIGNPVSYTKAVGVLQNTDGVVEQVTDREIVEAKAMIDQSGIGCEPASATTVAGIKKLVSKKVISPQDDVVAILTGHLLKDATANALVHRKGTIHTVSANVRSVEQLFARLEKYN